MANMVTTNFVSPKILAVLDRKLLQRATEQMMFDRFGVRKTIEPNANTKTAFAIRYKNVLPAMVPLAEFNGSNRIPGNKIVREEISYSVAQYGDYVKGSDELQLFDLRGQQINSDFKEILGQQASITVDTVIRNSISAGTNVTYADGATSRALVASGAKKFTLHDITMMGLKLKNQKGEKFHKVIQASAMVNTTSIRSAYIGIVSYEVVEDLRGLAGWKNVEDYSDYSKAIDGEVGSIKDFRIIEHSNMEVVDVGGTNVHISFFMAKNAYASTSLRGHGAIKSIVKKLGSAGSADPLDQEFSVGWKAMAGGAILNQSWIIRGESVPTFETGIAKHYYDYS